MPHTLLLADDSITIQRVIALTFAEEDVQVVAVDDGDKAIAMIDKSPPDLVLADLDMPGRSGLDLARHIKATPHLAHIPVLLLAGAFEPIDPATAAEAGCAGVLAKPFDPQVVVSRVRELLQHGVSVPAVTAPEPERLQTPPPASAAPQGDAQPSHVDEYLEELDAALSAAARAERIKPSPLPAERHDEAPPVSDWLRTPASSQAPLPPEPVPAAPSLTEAFAALLDAERSRPAPAVRSEPPIDDIVELAVQRVLERLSDKTIREMASDILTRVAERLVKEEIERIKRETL